MPLQTKVGVAMPLHKTLIGMRMLIGMREMGTTSCPPMEVLSEIPRELGARPKAQMSESLSKGAREGVKDLRTELDPLDKVQVTTPGTVKIGLKSGSVHKRSVEDT